MTNFTFETYGRYSREGEIDGRSYTISESAWGTLDRELTELEASVRAVKRAQGIEEDPPGIRQRDNTFAPHGWVGTYPTGIQVVPDKVDTEAYQTLLSESRGLIESFGLRNGTAAVPFAPDILRDARALYLRYSESLVDVTETLLAERLPVRIERETYVGRGLRGTPDFQRTVQQRAQRRPSTVSRTTQFSFQTLATRLLWQFNHNLRGRLERLRRSFDIDDPLLDRRIEYHDRIVADELPEQVTARSSTENALTSDELGRLTDRAEGPVGDLVDLWTAYRRQLSSDLNPAERYDTAIKPASKVYELWCLRKILTFLRSELGREQSTGEQTSIPSAFEFPGGVQLYYDRSVTAQSRYLKSLFRPTSGARAGAPDFMLEIDGEIRWLADAKFQRPHEIDLAGAQRFLSYVTDYLDPTGDGQAALLCISDSLVRRRSSIDGRRVVKFGLNPLVPRAEVRLLNTLHSVVSTA